MVELETLLRRLDYLSTETLDLLLMVLCEEAESKKDERRMADRLPPPR